MFKNVNGKIDDVSEEIQKIIDANAERYFLIVDINKNGTVSIFIGGNKKHTEVEGE